MVREQNVAMILWRNRKIDGLSKQELEFALQDAVLEIERLGRGGTEDASYTGYIWGFASAVSACVCRPHIRGVDGLRGASPLPGFANMIYQIN